MTDRIPALLLASFALCASPALAQSAPVASPGDIAALRTQIQAMQAELDKLQTAQAAAAQVPVPPAPKQSPGWWGNTSISGKAFFNVSNIDQKSDGADSVQNGTQTELKRFYIGVDHKFNDVFSANITTDFRYNSNGTSKDVLVYVKKAYVQAKLSPALFVRVGSADLPWVPFAEGLYGYRFVENTLIDRTKFGTSTDWACTSSAASATASSTIRSRRSTAPATRPCRAAPTRSILRIVTTCTW